ELQQRAPDRLAAIRRRVEAYSKDLEVLGVSDGQLPGSYPAGVAFRWAAREGLSLLLGLPLALLGMLLHALPYWLTAGAVRALRRSAEEEATDKIVAGTLFYPLCWAMEAWVAWKLGGGTSLAVLLVLLLPTGFLALGWQERLWRVARETRAFLQFIADRDLRQRLIARRRALVEEMTALARLVETPGLTSDAPRS